MRSEKELRDQRDELRGLVVRYRNMAKDILAKDDDGWKTESYRNTMDLCISKIQAIKVINWVLGIRTTYN